MTDQKLQEDVMNDTGATKAEVIAALKSTPRNEIPILPVNPDNHIEKEALRYIPYYEPDEEGGMEFEFIKCHFAAKKSSLLLVGPTGTGKTLMPAAFCQENGIALLQADCSEGTKKADLIGRFIILDNTVWFQLGTLPAAIEIANQLGKAAIDLEETNGLLPHMQKIVNQFLDWRDHVYVPEIGRLFKVKPENKLMIFATMNPSTYGGTHELNKDYKNRYTEIKITYPTSAQELEILESEGIDVATVKRFIQLGMELRAAESQGDVDDSPSPRTNQMVCDNFREYSKSKRISASQKGKGALYYALKHNIMNLFDVPNQQELVAKRIQRIFGINMNVVLTEDDDE